eukprot:TRINITY_DN2709_c0_g1_i3.p1 TRINITY_DN2709_c0_g1~~TRINITY_DN2709_c0_g1_i3.p1  ORF type:complete len:639 (-),score=217.94 TRINITY_DN2709_c0_g1_i3:82-1998(-)
MLHPHKRVSEIQEKQMTSVTDSNIHNIAVMDSTFDDCQAQVKDVFNILPFKEANNLAAINSINWARIMAQIVYYFYSYFQVTSAAQQQAGWKVVYTIPTGNFGNVLAGIYAKMMGLPALHFIVATNQNDILHRYFSTGVYSKATVQPSLSPSMDIQVSSNFERFLYHASGGESAKVSDWMKTFQQKGELSLPQEVLLFQRQFVHSDAISEKETIETIKECQEKSNYLLCPHSAVGYCATQRKKKENQEKKVTFVTMATAHPAKFPDAIRLAIGHVPPLPAPLEKLMKEPSRSKQLPSGTNHLLLYMKEILLSSSPSSTPLNSNLPDKFSVKVPGSSANMGGGFDVFGLGLSIYLSIDVQVLSQTDQGEYSVEITASGLGSNSITPIPNQNLVWKSFLFLLEKKKVSIPSNKHFKIHISNSIPLSRGLGSSGAAVVGGILAANRAFHLNLPKLELLQFCSEIEGHPDNVAGSLFGGLVACCCSEKGENFISPVALSDKLKAVVIVPDFEVSTEKARHLLPAQYPKADVVFNLQRVANLVLVLNSFDGRKIGESMRDRVHQPYRQDLVPGLQQSIALAPSLSSPAKVEGLLGVCLSGSGSSVLGLASSNFEQVGKELQKNFSSSQVLVLDIDQHGAQIIS